MLGIEHVIRWISKVTHTKEKENHEDPKMPTDFECFVCGTKFMIREELKDHLEKSIHGHLYDTTTPQEQKEVRSIKDENP